jgi:NAD(P)H dehydrogenase (quinone)
MIRVAIVYHTGFGHTGKQAHAVGVGAESVPGTSVRMMSVEQIDWEELHQSDAIIFGCPTYMGSGSAQFKSFMDASSRPWMQQKWKDKFAAGFTNSASQSGDKLSTLTQLAVFAAQHGMIWVSLGLPPGNNSSKGSVQDLNRLGSFLGAMAQSNTDQAPDVVPPEADLKTATFLGERVALLTQRWKAGANAT